MRGFFSLAWFAVVVSSVNLGVAQTIAQVEQVIRQEATKSSADPGGRPLPLAGHWNTGQYWGGFDPAYQKKKIEGGDYLLPWFQMPLPAPRPSGNGNAQPGTGTKVYYQNGMKWAASVNLPISFVGYNWEAILYGSPYYNDCVPFAFYCLPPDQNPNVIQLDGTIRKQLDPMGPIAPWREAGRLWASSEVMAWLQQLYPNPPLLVFVSNNEASLLPWWDANSSKRYVDKYGTATDEAFMRSVVANGWIERYRAFQEGFLAGLSSPSWRANSAFVGFNALGPAHFGRWAGWYYYALPFDSYIDPTPFMWNGGSPPYFLFNWNPSRDDQVWGPQGEAQNWKPMLADAFGINPAFRFELSTWDGDQAKRDSLSDITPFTPGRYGAMIEFGMWLLRPRVVREFRNGTDTVRNAGIWFDAILTVIKRVHQNQTLQRFWRNGQVVANHAWLHPYQDLTQYVAGGRYATVDRWFLLDTTLDPPHPFTAWTRLPVFALALQLGASPTRQWLLYAQAPQGTKSSVGITIPDYGQVTVSVPVEGARYLVTEGQPTVQLVQ